LTTVNCGATQCRETIENLKKKTGMCDDSRTRKTRGEDMARKISTSYGRQQLAIFAGHMIFLVLRNMK